ncbi:translation initiation factor IF-2-like [Panicum miliaceum]|uniref:Translation initiation factor IF-2-like n=1 Tax=Panicum miliaceum TaxID=4540 RepID=A0A3L6RZP7_PANMI|nr:translation initiation factor IF-2-like [Panicum miliaceum]
MALLRARIRRDPILPRHFSSSPPFPPPPSEPAPADPPPRSPFADVRDRLSSTSTASAPPIDDLRRKLRHFAKSHPSTSATHPPSSSSPGPSFLDVFSSAPSSPLAPNRSSPTPTPTRTPLDFGALRDRLKRPGSGAGGLPAPGASKFDWKSSLSPQRRRPAGAEASLGRDAGQKPEFLRQYSYDDLGKRLGDLRPAGAGKDGKEWFSLEELSARLGRLREVEKEERERGPMAGMGIGALQEALQAHALHTKDQKNAGGAPSMSALMSFGGQMVQGKPQEELMERYFHPDHLSSAEKMKLELKRVRDKFKMSENDCGSARVQGASDIGYLFRNFEDKHSRKGLQDMVQRRKKYLKYLRRTDWVSYCLVLKSLGLRDVPEYKSPDYKSKSNTKSKTKRKSKRKMKA